VTRPGRAAMFVVVAWLLAAVALLATQGMLLTYAGAAGAATLVWLGFRALVRQQRAPSMLEHPLLPERYRVADDLRRPLDDVVAVAEQEAESRP
jgi:threonine/homoserine/homoserine lactone efflux protein